jgi:hypothetical protein
VADIEEASRMRLRLANGIDTVDKVAKAKKTKEKKVKTVFKTVCEDSDDETRVAASECCKSEAEQEREDNGDHPSDNEEMVRRG